MNALPPQATATIGSYDAKTHFAELLSRVERGEQIVITRHGKPIARLVPEGRHDTEAARQALDRIFAQADAIADAGIRFTHEDLIAMRDEGRR